MKKWTLLLAFLVIIASLNAQSKKMKIAVMDFRNGVGVEKQEVQGLSDMLINTLYETKKFTIVERTQLDQVLTERNLQATTLTNEQLAKIGRILGVNAVLIGTVNFIASGKNYDGSYNGEYNVDVRAVDVGSAEVVTTAGATKTNNSTYREMMEKIGKQLAANLFEEEPVIVVETTPKEPEKPHFRKSGFTLRPEVGLNIPLNTHYYYLNSLGTINYVYATGLSAELAIGYQAGPHFFFGIIGGYGGRINANYDYKEGEYSTTFPIKANIRWYLIDHKYSFLIDLQAGLNLSNILCIDPFGHNIINPINSRFDSKFGLGFAVGNFEATVAAEFTYGGHPWMDLWRLNFNLAYRFGNVFKKWW